MRTLVRFLVLDFLEEEARVGLTSLHLPMQDVLLGPNGTCAWIGGRPVLGACSLQYVGSNHVAGDNLCQVVLGWPVSSRSISLMGTVLYPVVDRRQAGKELPVAHPLHSWYASPGVVLEGHGGSHWQGCLNQDCVYFRL